MQEEAGVLSPAATVSQSDPRLKGRAGLTGLVVAGKQQDCEPWGKKSPWEPQNAHRGRVLELGEG